jgi:DNA-directed RNA polymerase sigma subunit (sigma70/sigma32)
MEAANTSIKVETNPNISMSYEDIAKKLGISVKEVKEAEKSAMRKLRHPKVGKAFKDYLGIGELGENNGF